MTVACATDPQPPRAALVRVEDVEFHPRNVRRDLGDLREMVNSIARYGVLQPIVVESHGRKLRLRAGHRRLAAARVAGLARIPALVHAQALPEDEWIMQALHENTMRRVLDTAERADALKRLRSLGCTWQDIADSLGISVTTAQKWAAGQSIYAIPEPSPAVTYALPQPPSRERPEVRVASRKVVGLGAVRRFVEVWRRQPGVTVEQLLDALQRIADGALPADVIPPEEF